MPVPPTLRAMTHSGPAPAGIPNGPPAQLLRVRRKPGRARYDAAAVHAVLDAAPPPQTA